MQVNGKSPRDRPDFGPRHRKTKEGGSKKKRAESKKLDFQG